MNIRRDFTHSWRLLNNNKKIYLNVSPGGTKFSKPIAEMSMFFGRVFACLRGIKMVHCHVSLQKFINEINLRAANKLFPLSDPAFTEANKGLEHLQKSSEK